MRFLASVGVAATLVACGGASEMPPDVTERLARGRAALERGEAARAFPDLLAVFPYRIEVANDLAIAAKVVGRSGEALPHVEKALKQQPDVPVLLFVAASLQIDVGRLRDAERNLRRVLGSDPSHLPSLLLMAEMLTQADRSREALTLLLETEDPVCAAGRRVGADPGARHRTALFLRRLGDVHLDRGETAEGLRRLEEATRLDPAYAEGHYALGLARLQAKDLEGAARSLAEARRLAPGHVEAAYQAMNVAERLGRVEAAAEARERFHELYRERLDAAGALQR
jgi:tetratricopeptide (TPR) repeat protein